MIENIGSSSFTTSFDVNIDTNGKTLIFNTTNSDLVDKAKKSYSTVNFIVTAQLVKNNTVIDNYKFEIAKDTMRIIPLYGGENLGRYNGEINIILPQDLNENDTLYFNFITVVEYIDSGGRDMAKRTIKVPLNFNVLTLYEDI